jgi:hypothetical protein
MYRYAQIDNQGVCVGVSSLSGPLDHLSLIRLAEGQDVQLGDVYKDGKWTRPTKPNVPGPNVPGPSLDEVIRELQSTREMNVAVMTALFELYEIVKGGK